MDDDKIAYWVSVVLGGVSLFLLVTNVVLINCNRSLQTEISQRLATINDGVGRSQINQALVQALADASLKENDKDIRDMLNAQGITFKANKPAAKKGQE